MDEPKQNLSVVMIPFPKSVDEELQERINFVFDTFNLRKDRTYLQEDVRGMIYKDGSFDCVISGTITLPFEADLVTMIYWVREPSPEDRKKSEQIFKNADNYIYRPDEVAA